MGVQVWQPTSWSIDPNWPRVRPMASKKKPREITDWVPGWMALDDRGAKSACLHFFTSKNNGLKSGKPFEVLTVATKKNDLLSLREISISPLGAHGIKAPDRGDIVPDESKKVWVVDLFDKIYSKAEIDTSQLQNYLSTSLLRKVLTGHIIALHYSQILKLRQMNNLIKPETREKAGMSFVQSGESLTKATARIYTELQAWGETRAAAVIAEAEGVTPTTIHNRLQLARSGKYLQNPGKGARRKND